MSGQDVALPLPVTAASLTVEVIGHPEPQGSMGARIQGKRAIVFHTNATALARWRKLIVIAVQREMGKADWTMLTGPVRVDASYYFTRPKSVPLTRRWPCVKPDKDKLDRAVNDALTQAGAIKDDALIVAGGSTKRYCQPDGHEGVRITIRAAMEPS